MPPAAAPGGAPSISVLATSGCCALGADRAAIEANLRQGRVALGAAPFDLPFPAVVGKVADPLPKPPSRMSSFDCRVTRIALCGLDPLVPLLERLRTQVGPDRIGVVIGSSTGGIEATERALAALARDNRLPADYSFEDQHQLGALPRFVADLCGVSGPAYTVSTACSSGARALIGGVNLIAGGVCDVVVVGGVDSLCRMTVYGFHSLGILSPDGSRPFCRDRAGTHIGEGAGFLVLTRGAAEGPLAVTGWGDTSDAHSMAAPHPAGQGLERAIRAALARAALAPAAVDYVNAHGTGTQQNDAAEAVALAAVFGEQTAVSSTKGMTGHALGSAGAIELLVTALALERGFIPPNASSTRAGTEPLGLAIAEKTRPARLRRAMTVNAGFGGSNAAVVLEAHA